MLLPVFLKDTLKRMPGANFVSWLHSFCDASDPGSTAWAPAAQELCQLLYHLGDEEKDILPNPSLLGRRLTAMISLYLQVNTALFLTKHVWLLLLCSHLSFLKESLALLKAQQLQGYLWLIPLLSCSVTSGVQNLPNPPPLDKQATEFTSVSLCLGEILILCSLKGVPTLLLTSPDSVLSWV